MVGEELLEQRRRLFQEELEKEAMTMLLTDLKAPVQGVLKQIEDLRAYL